ncbi:hypothetical protein D3874_15595 [Oleomonas cavernae]|uniref:VCBS repeat-containing protein n=1 Tax=Oleomonas cavernae TaxID=2320859 RepID=A0A418WE34_9PROT|nr:hypothetical protein D3874_15595 [Oleomonas cavernae]
MAEAAAAPDGELRIKGDADDAVTTSDTGWLAAGQVLLEGELVNRFVNGAATLLIDAEVDTSGIQTVPTFGATVNAGGFDRQVIDVVTLSAARGFVIRGDGPDNDTGYSAAIAGDVNGDGFTDMIVGAFRNSTVAPSAGEAFVVFGSGSGFGTDVGGRQVVDTATLSAAQGFVMLGAATSDGAGWSVSSGGDINGDGLDDLVVGGVNVDDGGADAGAAYVVFGTAGTFGTAVGGRQVINFATLSAAQGFIVQGDTAGDQAGFSVASAGDINGDGITDLIVGAHVGDDGGFNAGEAYVVFGTTAGFGINVSGRQVLDLTSLSAAQGFIIQGDSAVDYAGESVASAGDINGDGFDDLIVGARKGDDGGTDAGEAYVLFGGAGTFGTDVGGRQVIDLTTLSAAQGFVIQGDTAGDDTGRRVSSAGDVNGDGITDLIVGATNGDDGGNGAGEAYVIFGTTAGFGTDVGGRQVIDLTTLSAAQGFIIQGDADFDGAGRAVSTAGDVNGDGYGDLIVGAPAGDDGGNIAGEAYVIFGTADGFGVDVGGRQVIDLAALTASEGFIIQGEYGDLAGRSITSGATSTATASTISWSGPNPTSTRMRPARPMSSTAARPASACPRSPAPPVPTP